MGLCPCSSTSSGINLRISNDQNWSRPSFATIHFSRAPFCFFCHHQHRRDQCREIIIGESPFFVAISIKPSRRIRIDHFPPFHRLVRILAWDFSAEKLRATIGLAGIWILGPFDFIRLAGIRNFEFGSVRFNAIGWNLKTFDFSWSSNVVTSSNRTGLSTVFWGERLHSLVASSLLRRF